MLRVLAVVLRVKLFGGHCRAEEGVGGVDGRCGWRQLGRKKGERGREGGSEHEGKGRHREKEENETKNEKALHGGSAIIERMRRKGARAGAPLLLSRREGRVRRWEKKKRGWREREEAS